jgi:hypothetical protein
MDAGLSYDLSEHGRIIALVEEAGFDRRLCLSAWRPSDQLAHRMRHELRRL